MLPLSKENLDGSSSGQKICVSSTAENSHLKEQLQQKIDTKTKPIGSLGLIEALALKIGAIQNTLTPSLRRPALIVFAGDHGIAKGGVSAYPQAVTHQMVTNFLAGGAAINVFCRQHNIDLKIVDAGVNHHFEHHKDLIDGKIAMGTRNFLSESAMTQVQFDKCVEKGKRLVEALGQTGCNIVGFGEMGIGNTSSAAMLVSHLCELPIEQCVGRGSGIDQEQLQHKTALLKRAKALHGHLPRVEDVCRTFGGFEMVQMYGAMLEARRQNMLLLIDGFIASSVFLAAHAANASLMDHAIFCHLSGERGHQRLLDHLGAEPILKLGMRLGEGTGVALAYPIVESAVHFLNEMASFESAGVHSNR